MDLPDGLDRSSKQGEGLPGLFSTFCLLMLTALPVWSQSAPDPRAEDLSPSERIETLIERIKHEQSQLRTSRLVSWQHKESQLLLEPEVSTGHCLSYHAPDRVRWELRRSPTDTLVVVRRGQTC